jgi:hypothetical protein
MSRTARWVIGMSILGLTVAVIVLILTDSWWWAAAGLIGSGIVANSIASARAAGHRGPADRAARLPARRRRRSAPL